MNKFFYYLIASMVSTLFYSCTKEKDGDTSILKTVVYSVKENQDKEYTIDEAFTYNNNKLTAITYTSHIYAQYAIEYDSIGRLFRCIVSDKEKKLYSYTYLYNNSGQVVKRIATPLQSSNEQNNHAYGYDAAGRLAADTQFIKRTPEVASFLDFCYDANNNLVRIDSTSLTAAVPTRYSTATTFDNNPNPYNQLGLLYYFIINNNTSLSRNNYTQQHSTGFLFNDHKYTYKGNGLPKQITINSSIKEKPYEITTIKTLYYK